MEAQLQLWRQSEKFGKGGLGKEPFSKGFSPIAEGENLFYSFFSFYLALLFMTEGNTGR